MSNIGQSDRTWRALSAPPDEPAPGPLTVRVQSLAPRSYFPEHAHDWAQVVYAVSGVLTVSLKGASFVISPEQAVWLPPGTPHRVGSLHGAEFRSLWIARAAARPLPARSTVFRVEVFLRALIVEAAALRRAGGDAAYAGRVTRLILDQLRRAQPIPAGLPWPQGGPLARLCEALYAEPADDRSAAEWGRLLGMSTRTLTRRFEAEMGISLRSWRRRMRLFKAIEMLGGGLDVTRTALELGYGSPSAFIYAFRTEMGQSPQAYMKAAA